MALSNGSPDMTALIEAGETHVHAAPNRWVAVHLRWVPRSRAARIRKGFFATTFMSWASGEIDSCSASSPDRFLSKFASHAGCNLPGIPSHLVQVPGDWYAHPDEM